MKNRRLFLVTILAAIICFSGNVFALLSGAGTGANPYLIQSRADFNEFTNPVNASLYWVSGVYTKLTCDIDFADEAISQIAPTTNPTRSGFQGTPFSGIFDGSNKVLSHFQIIQPDRDYVGLFGYIDNGGQVKNLCLESFTIAGYYYVGGLCGYNDSGLITHSYATGSVSGIGSYVGGLCGYNDSSSITTCYAMGVVSGYSNIGGLVGHNGYGSITDSYSTGVVSGNNSVGGLVGENYWYGSVTSCYATGAVSGNDSVGGLVGKNRLYSSITYSYATGEVGGNNSFYVGGLCGYNDSSSISGCYASGSVSGGAMVGGLVGENYSSSSITYSYATGAVSGNNSVGGLVGYNAGSITACYATGVVSGGLGLCGNSYGGGGVITNSFWDTQTSGQTISAGGTGKTTAEMKSINTFLSASWDFVGETTNGSQDIWRMITGSYPIHSWIEAFALNKTELTMTEGQTASFEVVLPYAPTADVAINLSISGSGNFELLTASTLTFNVGDWQFPKVVSVRVGFDDNYLNDKATLVIQSRNYRAELPLREIDIQPKLQDVIIVSSEDVIVQEGKQTSFTVMLAEDPLEPVDVHLTISGDPNISIGSAAVLSFDSNNYAVPQTVTVKSRWDAGIKNTQAQLLLSSPALPERLFKTVTITKQDRVNSFCVSSENVIVQEGNEASFTVMLAEDPLEPLGVHLTISGDPYISISSAAVLSFDSSNYAVPQTVKVKSRWDTGKKDTQAKILLSSPYLPERQFKIVTIVKKDKGKPIILSKPPALLDAVSVMTGTNVSYLSDDFANPSDVAWYSYRVGSVPGIPGVKGTPGHYYWVNLSYYKNGWYYEKWERRWESGTPGRPAVPAKNRASITFTSDKLSQTGSAWVAIYQKVDSQYKLVKKMLFKQGKSSKLKFVGKADVDYYVSVTPVDTNLGAYSISVTKAAVK